MESARPSRLASLTPFIAWERMSDTRRRFWRQWLVGILLALTLILTALAIRASAQSAAFPPPTVYVTEHGRHYHLWSNCVELRHHQYYAISVAEARSRTVCAVCAMRGK